MRVGSLFTGYGGLDQAVESVTGARTAWVSDIDKGANKILAHRYPDVPNIGDIATVDWSRVEPVEILTGGFPCQDLSHAGLRKGLRPETRSGLWLHMAYAIEQLRPQLVVAENVRGLLSAKTAESREVVTIGPKGGRKVGHTERALGRVLSDLADLGYDARWFGLRAADVGAPHPRFRVILVAAPQDSDITTWGERRLAASGQAQGGGAWADTGGRSGAPSVGVTLLPTPAVNDMGAGKSVEDWDAWTDKMKALHGNGNGHGKSLSIEAQRADFGKYDAAVRRWESLTRPAPNPTDPTGRDGAQRLSPRFVEWMMGQDEGWITDVPDLSRNDQLKALGNGVVRQQASAALCAMLSA